MENKNIIKSEQVIKISWEKIQIDMKDKFGKDIYDSWLRKITFEEEFNNYVLMSVTTRFIRDWITSRYLDQILGIVRSYKSEINRIELLVNEEQNNEKVKKADYKFNDNSRNNISFIKDYVFQYNRIDLNKNFDSFITGSSNKLAFEASKKISNKTSNYNPLYIYGGVGMGKTHLLNAIGLKLKEESKVMFISAERFMYQFVKSIKSNEMVKFKDYFRNSDVFLIDDIQFMNGKEAMQEEFFHTFNALLDKGSQIIISGDRPPNKLSRIQERIKSRFSGGLVIDIQPPDYEMRVAILLEKAEQNGLTLEYPMVEFIATHIKKNIRELEGAIIRILAKSSLLNKEIDKTLVFEVIKERVGSVQNKDLTIESIVKQVSLHSKISENDIVGKSRKMEVSKARQISMYICRNITDASLNNIGVYFGGRDHTTVMHAINNIEKKKLEDLRLKETISTIKKELSPPPF